MPLNLVEQLKPMLARKSASVGPWLLALAEAQAEKLVMNAPARWLEALANAFGVSADERVPEPGAYFEHLSKGAWADASLLGEWLSLLRANTVKERKSRAGRVSEGCVYTPSSVARSIIAEVHVGARRVVDPACGAGVFLVEAFRRAFARRVEGGAEPREAAESALLHEIAGVDIDKEALAVAEFSLRLEALRCAGLDHDVAIDLRCADALDALEGLDGACECAVGNPPFVEGRGLSEKRLDALRERFRCASEGKVNLFAVFVERGLELLRDDGVLAFVLPSTFQRNTRYKKLRELLLEHTLESIKPLDRTVFEGRVVEAVVLRVRKKPPVRTWQVEIGEERTLQSRLPVGPVLRFCDPLPGELRERVDRMEQLGRPLGEFFEVRDGISTGFQPFPLRLLGVRDGDAFRSDDGARRPFDPAKHRPIIDGSEFNAFSPIQWAGRFIEYDKSHEHHPPHPGRPFNCQLRDPAIYDRAEKLLTRQTARGLIATVDRERYFVRNSVHTTFAKAEGAELSLDALCACLNSPLYTEYFLAATGEHGDVFPQVHIADIKRLPILPELLKRGGELEKLGRAMMETFRKMPVDRDGITSERAEVDAILKSAWGC